MVTKINLISFDLVSIIREMNKSREYTPNCHRIEEYDDRIEFGWTYNFVGLKYCVQYYFSERFLANSLVNTMTVLCVWRCGRAVWFATNIRPARKLESVTIVKTYPNNISVSSHYSRCWLNLFQFFQYFHLHRYCNLIMKYFYGIMNIWWIGN